METRTALLTLAASAFVSAIAKARGVDYETRVRAAVRSLWSKGLYPSPTKINIVLGRKRSSHLGSDGPRIRREEMARLGIPLQRRPNGRLRTVVVPREIADQMLGNASLFRSVHLRAQFVGDDYVTFSVAAVCA